MIFKLANSSWFQSLQAIDEFPEVFVMIEEPIPDLKSVKTDSLIDDRDWKTISLKKGSRLHYKKAKFSATVLRNVPVGKTLLVA